MGQTKKQIEADKRDAIARSMEWAEWLALNNPGLLDEDAIQSFTDYFLDLHWKQMDRLVFLICEEICAFVNLKTRGGPLILAEIIRMAIALGGHIELMTDDPDDDNLMQVRFMNVKDEDCGEPDPSVS